MTEVIISFQDLRLGWLASTFLKNSLVFLLWGKEDYALEEVVAFICDYAQSSRVQFNDLKLNNLQHIN